MPFMKADLDPCSKDLSSSMMPSTPSRPSGSAVLWAKFVAVYMMAIDLCSWLILLYLSIYNLDSLTRIYVSSTAKLFPVEYNNFLEMFCMMDFLLVLLDGMMAIMLYRGAATRNIRLIRQFSTYCTLMVFVSLVKWYVAFSIEMKWSKGREGYSRQAFFLTTLILFFYGWAYNVAKKLMTLVKIENEVGFVQDVKIQA